MTTSFEEEHQRFTFDSEWYVFKYDCAETGFEKISHSIQSTKACDYLAIFNNERLFFIEVKDFRGYRITNKHRLKQDELATEIALKVKDTLAGIIAGWRRADVNYRWSAIGKLITTNRPVKVVLCLEDDISSDINRWKTELSIQEQSIQKKLSWLNVRVIVVSQKINPNALNGLVVHNLEGAGSAT